VSKPVINKLQAPALFIAYFFSILLYSVKAFNPFSAVVLE
jgi:hypothetical protein